MGLRALHSSEAQLLRRLVAVDFPGPSEVAQQLREALAEPIDANGSLRFIVQSNTSCPVARRIPVEAEVLDSDGIRIHALLHVVDGTVFELEIYKDDSSAVNTAPFPDAWEVIVLDSTEGNPSRRT